MPQTGAERNRKYREKIKANAEAYEAYKERDRERKKASRKRVISSPRKSAIERKKVRDRVRLHRLRKKLGNKAVSPQNVESNECVYKTPQSLGKAVKKVSRQLPSSPRKRKVVISKIAESSGISVKQSPQDLDGNSRMPDSTVKKVQEFYCRDTISRQSPGRKDCVILRDNGKKSKLQKRYLMWSLKETYHIFQEEYPNTKIGLSKFCSLRPNNVLLQSSTPRDVCLCQYHDNVKMLCETLCKKIPSFPIYSRSFVENLVCSSNNEKCMTGKCENCPSWFETVKKDAALNLEEFVEWSQWERVAKTYKAKNGKVKVTKQMVRVIKEGTVEEALESLKSKIPSFLEHVFIQRKQASYFQECITKLGPDQAIVQVDFAENYTCQYQDEIQAAHWSQEQVTLFTIAIWTKDSNDETVCSSHVIVSDDHSHEKTSVAVFMDMVINDFIKESFPNVKQVDIFSDGPSSQFKNKFMTNFYHILKRKGLQIKWHFFATSHGKGVVDGLGGTVKRVVWNAVLTRKVSTVLNAREFAKTAKDFCTSVKITLCSREDILKSSESLALDKCFKEAKSIRGIKRFHSIEPIKNGLVNCRLYSSQSPCTHLSSGKAFESDLSYDSTESKDANDISDIGTDTEDASGISDCDTESEAGSDITSHGNDEPFKDSLNSSTVNADRALIDDSISPAAENTTGNIQIELGLPSTIASQLNDVGPDFSLPPHHDRLVEMIVDGKLPFDGEPLVTNDDLKDLCGNSPSIQDKWLSNFAIDAYLKLLKSSMQHCNHVNVEVFSWEEFERSVGNRPLEDILQDKGQLLEEDIILIPCNPLGSKHWFLLVVYPTQHSIVVLDSLAGSCVKPKWQRSVQKMMKILQSIDNSIDFQKWTFYASVAKEIPQQSNAYDCGVFVCLYGRCLVHKDKLIPNGSICVFRKMIILELFYQKLFPIPPIGIQIGEYYAVDFVSNFYLGRVLDKNGDFGKFEFLHRVGAFAFDWPRRDDIDNCHNLCVFFGPVQIQGNGPFHIPQQSVIEKLFKELKD